MTKIHSALIASASIAAALLVPASDAVFAATWKVDNSASKLGITATINGAPVEGRFEKFTARIDFDPEKPEAADIRVNIDLSAVRMNAPQQTAALASAGWFNTAQYPAATFTSTRIRATGPNRFEMSAALTLKGRTVPVTLPFTFTTTGSRGHATGEFVIMRNDFSVGTGPFSSGSSVGLKVRLSVDITAERID